MSTVAEPGGGGGLKASITPVLTCWNTNAAAVPKLTTSFILFRPRFVPLINTGVPGGPCVGLIAVMTARDVVTKVNFVLADVPLVPTGVVTEMSTVVPPARGGLEAMSGPGLSVKKSKLSKKADVFIEPNRTAFVPPRSVPVMRTCVPPSPGPWFGLAALIVGAGLWLYVNGPLAVPAGVVTWTRTVPAPPGGVTTASSVALELNCRMLNAGFCPNMIEAPCRLEPMMYVTVPPLVGPLFGVM